MKTTLRSIEELRRREGFYIRSAECVNRFVAGRTMTEYKTENTDLIKQKSRESYYRNLEHYRERKKNARLQREKHKERIRERRKQHYEQNKEKERAKALEQYYI